MPDEQSMAGGTMMTQPEADSGTATRQGFTPLTWADVSAEDRAAMWEGVILPPPEQNLADGTSDTLTAAGRVAGSSWADELLAQRRVLFDLLRRSGYDRVEVEYEGDRGVYTVLDMTFYKGATAVPENDVPEEVSEAVWEYVAERIPTEGVYTVSCDGSVRIYVPSEYACFKKYVEAADFFWDGEDPGEEVPEEDVWPSADEEFLESYSDDFGVGVDGDDEDEDDDHDDEDGHDGM